MHFNSRPRVRAVFIGKLLELLGIISILALA